MADRKALSKKTRFEVFKRDGFVCQYCGAHPLAAILHVDHIVAVADGGGDDMDNLVTSCQPCNLGKAARALSSIPQTLQDKAAEVAEREEQLMGYQAVLQSKRDRLEDEAWGIAAVLDPNSERDGFRTDWLISIKKFLDKLGYHDVHDSAEMAIARIGYFGPARFKYFCGICWTKIRESEPPK